MNTFKIVILLLVVSFGVHAQEFTGVATYQTKTTLDMENFGGREMSEQMKKQIAERMKNFLEKSFTLKFNKVASIYEEEDKLEAPGANGGMRFMGGGFSQGGIYKNVASDTYARENELMGKVFLVHDSLIKYDWKLEKDSKMIGQYAAFKATATRKLEESLWGAFRRRGRAQDSTATDSVPTSPKQETITVWYTPQIPINQGPDEFWGLPGLILEVNVGRTVIICNKIVLNPQEELNIEEPKKGDEVSRQEYETIVKQKTEEMRERYGRRRGGRGGFGRG